MRIRRRATMHMAFVLHFEKRRLEFQPQFAFKNCLHGIRRLVYRAALYNKIRLADRDYSNRNPCFHVCESGFGPIGHSPPNLINIYLQQSKRNYSNFMPVSWYPGHMHKARKELGLLLRGARLVIEVLDARIPAASANPLLASMRGDLPLIRVLNKSDLADSEMTAAWQAYLADFQNSACLRSGRDELLDRNRLLKQINRLGVPPAGQVPQSGRIAITGIPNVGKSSLLNRCIGRKLARTGNTPSITREQQFVRFTGEWTLVDTPGMLRPRLEDQNAALLMACVGSIGAAGADNMEVAPFLAEILLERRRERLAERYRLENIDISAESLFDRIAVSRGALRKTGLADYDKAADILLQDFRNGRLGRITLENPPNHEIRHS